MLFLRGVQPAVLASLIGVAASSSSDNTNTPDSCDNSAQAKNAIRLFNEKIKNVVVLAQENRSFDTFAGGLNYTSDIDGLVHRAYCNPRNITIQNDLSVCARPIGVNVEPNDPDHSLSGVSMQIFGTYRPNETAVNMGLDPGSMMGFLYEQQTVYNKTNLTTASRALDYLTPDHIPVFSAMAENFCLFDEWFAAVPGPTNCNRAYLTSGTSHGYGNNENFGTSSPALPQRSIFQQLTEKSMSWINYSNRTAPSTPDAAFYDWTRKTGMNKTNILTINRFFDDAKAGKLPQFSYINPECCLYNSYHPPSPVDMGELFIKQIYEALRSSPQWNSTLFILTFDEHGGYADHVTPPVNVPAGDNLTWTEKAQDGKNVTFAFTRLGIRVPTILVSPWIKKGKVEHRGRNFGGVYTHTSILNTLASVWGLDRLTPRSAWSATFEHLIGEEFRADAPKTLPQPVVF